MNGINAAFRADGNLHNILMVRACVCLAVFVGIAAEHPVKAQPGPTVIEASRGAVTGGFSPIKAVAATVPCTLHIWPSGTTHTTFQGWTHAGAVDGARRGIKGYPDMDADAIDTAHQVKILASLDWRGMADDPNLVVVVHPAPTGSEDDRGRTSRLITDGSDCYREVIITSSLVEVATFSTRSVRILALRKTFDGAAPPVNFSSMTKAVIDLPEKIQPGDPQIDVVTRAAFAAAVRKFAVILSFH